MTIDLPFIFELFAYVLRHWWAVAAGTVVGVVAGAVPGLNPSNTIIVLMPLTLAMGPDAGLMFMVTIYCAAQLGNGIPAILVKIPGTGGAAATVLDGYPMAVQGKGMQALVLSFVASILAGVVAAIATFFALPYLGQVGLLLHSVEMVVIMVLGLALIAVIAAQDTLKALIAGFIGLLLGAIGTDFVYARPRATFGLYELYDGVPLVPALIGLFAISEALSLIKRSRIVEEGAEELLEVRSGWAEVMEGVRLTLSHWWEVVRSTVVGFVVGAIPGAGASIAAFAAYQQARLFSRTPERFGKGAPEGVIAPEAANNAVTAGAMVPLLTLGVPGGLTTAVMLVALQYHGVHLGPRLFIESPLLAYGVFATMVVAYVILIFTILPMTGPIARLTMVPTQFLVPMILTFTLVGSFVSRNLMFDMALAILFGVLGYVAQHTGFPVVSMVIGLILGPLFETYLTRALRISHGDITVLFSSPIGNVLWVLVILSLVVPYVKERRARRAPAGGVPAAGA